MNRLFYLLFLLLLQTVAINGQEKLTITPAFAERNQAITITYDPQAAGALIADTAQQVELVFSYSNLYGIANKIMLEKKGNSWQTSFVLPYYATYATFYLQAAAQKEQAAPGKHFELAVYEKGQRVMNGYLYEGYSLPAQTGKVPDLAERQALLFSEELKRFPDNYEAKLRLLNYRMTKAADKEKAGLRKEALGIIAAKFYEKPGDMGLMNKTTMGYLIIGENSRVDSIREVVKKKYPRTEAGYELIIGAIDEETDTVLRVKQLLQLVKKETPANRKYLKDAHKLLFEYYTATGQTAKALAHLKKLGADTSPYAPQIDKEQAAALMKAGIALDTAFMLAQRSFEKVSTYPAGIIRYFPETGYIPSYISPELRAQTTAKMSGNLFSLMALIRMKQGRMAEAEEFAAKALRTSTDQETLSNAAVFYEAYGSKQKAFELYKQLLYDIPEDTIAQRKMKANFVSFNTNAADWDKEWNELTTYWNKTMRQRLEKEIIRLPAPAFVSSLVDMKGNRLSPDFIKNKTVVIDLWATWCVPCMQEMPYLQNAYQQYKDDTTVVFMIINTGSKNTLADAQGWWGNKRYNFPVYYTYDREMGDKFKFNVIPATFIIDRKGDIRFKHIGFEGPVVERKIVTGIKMLKEMTD